MHGLELVLNEMMPFSNHTITMECALSCMHWRTFGKQDYYNFTAPAYGVTVNKHWPHGD